MTNVNSSNRSVQLPEVLFTVTQNGLSFSNNCNAGNDTNLHNGENMSNIEEITGTDTVLCILWKNSKLGAAYYKISDQLLCFYSEIIDMQPQYLAMRSLVREVNPRHIITMGTPCDQFVKVLIDVLNGEDDQTINSNQVKTVPSNLSLISFKDYSYDLCEYKIYDLKLSSEPENIASIARTVYLHSLIEFDSKLSVHALGALIKFTEKNWAHLNPEGSNQLCFAHISSVSLVDHVFMDRNTFNALQIFKVCKHDASFKHGGGQSSNKEGISIFKLFSQHCKSKLGCVYLRNVLSHPIKNIDELNKRLDFIEFTMIPNNQGFIESLQDNIKKLSDINRVIVKIQNSKGNLQDWDILNKTIYHILFLNELCGPYRASSLFLRELDEVVTANLYDLQNSLDSTIDFINSRKYQRPSIKFGLDEDLDKKKLKLQDMAKHIAVAARFAASQLPDYIQECSVVYIPEMGYLVALKEWGTFRCNNQLEDLGFQFMFTVHGTLHYKNAMCREMDRHIGTIHDDIIAHENRIIQRLSGFVLRYQQDIRRPLQIIAFIDCLISMSKVAKDKGYVRPLLNDNNVHEIEDGRHPLLELHGPNFVPNSYKSGGDNSRLKIITGPNASGKSVFLKQNALLIYLAHIGSFLPVKFANISMIHSIHSRIHAVESASIELSAFMIDLSQMSQALYHAMPSSLVIVDEFGRGTDDTDGLALLIGAIKHFLNGPKLSPHVLVSTHFENISNYLSELPSIDYMKMDHELDKNGQLVYLYKIVEGVSTSFAVKVASVVGLDSCIIQRAEETLETLCDQQAICPVLQKYNQECGTNTEDDFDFFTNLSIPDLDKSESELESE